MRFWYNKLRKARLHLPGWLQKVRRAKWTDAMNIPELHHCLQGLWTRLPALRNVLVTILDPLVAIITLATVAAIFGILAYGVSVTSDKSVDTVNQILCWVVGVIGGSAIVLQALRLHHRSAACNHIAACIREGRHFTENLIRPITPGFHKEMCDWYDRTGTGLKKHLGDSWLVRFQVQVHKSEVPDMHLMQLGEIQARVGILEEFLKELGNG
jgi:hypothetical protein